MQKKASKYFLRIIFIFFLVFVALLIAYESGYYETKVRNRAILTQEAMEQFEEDVANGEPIDVIDYLEDEEVDYTNTLTKLGNKVASGISDIMTKGLAGLVETLKGLFW